MHTAEDPERAHQGGVQAQAMGVDDSSSEDDEEEEKEPQPPAEEVADLMEAALGMYPTNVKGGIDAELKKLIME